MQKKTFILERKQKPQNVIKTKQNNKNNSAK